MITIASPTVRKHFARAFAAAAILGVLATGPAFAENMTVPGAPSDVGTRSTYSAHGQDVDSDSSATQATRSISAKGGHASSGKMMDEDNMMHEGKMHSPEQMAAHVEKRIANLHEKLKITPAQESGWGDVAQAMRDNEANMSQLIQSRHQAAKEMSAVDDLASYQKIAQAHADGLGKVISAFQSLYDDMSDEQKKNADEVFGRFEGHRGMSKASMDEGSTKSSHKKVIK